MSSNLVSKLTGLHVKMDVRVHKTIITQSKDKIVECTMIGPVNWTQATEIHRGFYEGKIIIAWFRI